MIPNQCHKLKKKKKNNNNFLLISVESIQMTARKKNPIIILE